MIRNNLLVAVISLAAAGPALAAAKNWTPPNYRIYAQQLADETMKVHSDLLSVTFHGIPPGMTDTYTMFAGSYPDRIGNGDDPDDIDVQKLGITIVDPRWHRPHDTAPKFVVQTPLRDRTGENIGLIVYAFNKPSHPAWTEGQYTVAAMAMRDALEKQIPSYAALFAPIR
jgi:hypothetical protein